MSRVAKTGANPVLQRSAGEARTTQAPGARPPSSPAATADGMDARTLAARERLTPADLKRAVASAKAQLAARYALDGGLSEAERKSLSKSGELAVRLAQELKAAAVAGD